MEGIAAVGDTRTGRAAKSCGGPGPPGNGRMVRLPDLKSKRASRRQGTRGRSSQRLVWRVGARRTAPRLATPAERGTPPREVVWGIHNHWRPDGLGEYVDAYALWGSGEDAMQQPV
jgi:hypothetical protein